MTLPVFTSNRSGPYAANGVNREWDFDFKVIRSEDVFLEVYDSLGARTDIDETQFEIDGLDDNAGGTITYPVSPASPLATGYTVYVTRATVLDQPYGFKNQGGFFPELHEQAFDRLVMMMQDAPFRGYTSLNPVANAVIGWNAAGTDLENKTLASIGAIEAPSSSTNNAVIRWGGTEASAVKDSSVLIDDSGNVSGVGNLSASGYLDLSEIVSPLAPAANTLRFFALDVAGVTRPHYRQSAGAATRLQDHADILDDIVTGDADVLFRSTTVGTADGGDVGVLYALSDEGDYEPIEHILKDDYNLIIRISRVASLDGGDVPMDIALASRGTLDAPLPMQAGDRSWAIAAGGRAPDGTWQRLLYQWAVAKGTPSGNSIPGMWVLRVTKPTEYFPRDILNADWTDGIRHYAHSGFTSEAGGIPNLTDAATIAWDVKENQVAEVTIAGNRTLEPSGAVDGFKYDLFVTADASARILSLSSAGGREWYLRGSDGIFYDQNSPIALPANGFAHIEIDAGGSGLIYSGKVNFIIGHPQRAVAPSMQITALAANRSGANNTSAQSPFAATEDAFTVNAATSYRFRAVYSFTITGVAANHTVNTLFGGTATLTSIGYRIKAACNEATLGGPTPFEIARHSNVATATDVFGTVINEVNEAITIELEGIVRINAAGTFIPQIQFGTNAPGAAPSFLAGCFFEMWPIGSNTVVAVGNLS